MALTPEIQGSALTHVDSSREGLAFGQYREPVTQVRDVVLGLNFVSVEWFVTLQYQPTVISLTRLLTWRTTYGSNLAVAKAVVLVSTMLSAL